MPALTATLLLGLLGCQRGYQTNYTDSHLPEWVSATVRFKDGSYGSALVTMSNPRNPPELRYVAGLWVFDGKRMLKLEPSPRFTGGADGGARVVQDLEVWELAGGVKRLLPIGDLGTRLTIDAVVEGQINVSIDGQSTWYDAASGEQSLVPGPEWDTHHFGPGEGFDMVLRQDDVLALRLPMADKGLPLFKDVDALVAMSWITSDRAEPGALAQAEALYKAVMPVFPVGEAAVADGDLSEWRGAKALAVDEAPCVMTGIGDWSGPRDGSFGVAARVTGGRLVVAVRVRDDQLRYGEDRLEVELGARSWEIPIQDPGPLGTPGLKGAFTDPMDYGTGLEISLPLPPPPEDHAPLPLVVRYLDMDEGEEITTLATAPSMRALAIRTR